MWLLCAFVVAAVGACLLARARWRLAAACCLALVLGIAWADWRAESRLKDRLDPALEGQDILVEGLIDNLPRKLDQGIGFDFVVERAPAGVPSTLRLAWYAGREPASQAFALQAGERWALLVRLKRPWGNSNPHTPDYAGQLFAQGIGAHGYVRDGAGTQRVSAFDGGIAHRVERLRGAIRARMEEVLDAHPWRATLIALAIGEQREVPSEHWALYARTGITHLISVSGVHILMWAVLAGGLLGGLWRRWPAAAARWPAQRVAAVAGLVAALAYSALAGWGVPAQRTVLMLGVASLGLLSGRAITALASLALALLAVLVFDPWAVTGRGFWLSFLAVALLMLVGSGLQRRTSRVGEWWRAQWAIALGLAVPLLALTGQISLVAPAANAVAIPVVGFAVLPLVLLFVALPWPPLLHLAAWIFDRMMALLALLATPDWAVWQPAQAPAVALAAAMLGAVALLMPRGTPWRPAGVLLILPLLLWKAPRPEPGHFELTVLDVGQGLAVHVQTETHALLFDTGPRYGRSADAGQRVVLPYLRGEGVSRLDRLIVSHEDADHSGGAASLLATLPVGEVEAAVPEWSPLRGLAPTLAPCVRGETWRWDGVRFEMLNPAPGVAIGKQGNGSSCVLRVSVAGASVLLTADIDKAAEGALISAGTRRAEDLVVAPHHGSRSSSSDAFVQVSRPRWVVFAAGYRSRFGHPHPEVVARYRSVGARVLRSDRDGAIRVTAGPAGLDIQRWRPFAASYWTAPWQGHEDKEDTDAVLDSGAADLMER
ncbi:DNA internalization-related competence protein ComEC/Rec2 [Niveibacterium sp. SC-1]|uniref:DNA internalization-related competence protein ComEC/Rec2 n=1 Tax=Niveibacterium sp. SC-1 TaxID=3135646 RepID=UPI00311F1E76